MKGIQLPRNMKVKKNEDGTISIVSISQKMHIPLRCFEKMSVLNPSAVRYLENYKNALNKNEKKEIVNTKTLERIEAILKKPQMDKDPITSRDSRVEPTYTEAHFRRMGYKGYDDYKAQEDKKLAEAKAKREEMDKQDKAEKDKKK